jgi:heptosyltransferase-2
VRRLYPDAHIAVLVRHDTARGARRAPASTVLIDDKRGRDRGLGSGRWCSACAASASSRLALHKSFRTAWMLAAARIPRRIGFRQSAGWFLYHRRVPRDPTRHDVERNLQILAGLDVDPNTSAANRSSPARRRRWPSARDTAGARGRRGFTLIGIAPGSAWATKRWTVEGYAALVDAATAPRHNAAPARRTGDDYAAAIARRQRRW